MEEKKEEKILEEENVAEGIQISSEVIAVIAGVAVSEIPGVFSMDGGFAGGISEVLKGKKNLAKGIKVDSSDGKTKIDVNIIVEYGTRIPDVATVNVHVKGVNTQSLNSENDNNEPKEEGKE